jgi:hypothetical protein
MPKQLYIPLPCGEARRQMVLRQLGPGCSVEAQLSGEDLAKVVAKTDVRGGGGRRGQRLPLAGPAAGGRWSGRAEAWGNARAQGCVEPRSEEGADGWLQGAPGGPSWHGPQASKSHWLRQPHDVVT